MIIVIVFLLLLYVFYSKRSAFPPGPFPLPILGNFLQFDLANPHRTILAWRARYGPVFTVWLPKPIVVIASKEVLQETLVGQADAFSARPSSFLYRMFTGSHHEGDGIILSSGERWHSQRSFALRTLKTFGFGGGEMEVKVNHHLDRLLERFDLIIGENRKSAVFDPHQPLAFCIGNIIQDLVLGKSYEYGDPEFAHFKHLIDSTLAQVQSVQMLVADCFPALACLLPGYHRYRRNGQALQDFFLKEVAEHEKVLTMDGPPRDFIEAYLRMMKEQPDNKHFRHIRFQIRRKNSNSKIAGKQKRFSHLTLALDAGDLWTGGMETTVTTIRWGIIYLVHHPEVQKRMRAEISELCGSSRLLLSHRPLLPFTRAVIAEVQRLANVLPWNIPHCTTSTCFAGDFALSAGVDVMPHLGAAHHDPADFSQPEEFRPERMLNELGEFAPPSAFSPFGLGRRQCLGENLAKMELFLIFCTLVQHYNFRFAPGGPLPSLQRRMGMASVPKDFVCEITKIDI